MNGSIDLFQEFIMSELSYFPEGHSAHSIKQVEVLADHMDFSYCLRAVVKVKSCKAVPFHLKIDDLDRFLNPKIIFDPRSIVFYLCYTTRKYIERKKKELSKGEKI